MQSIYKWTKLTPQLDQGLRVDKAPLSGLPLATIRKNPVTKIDEDYIAVVFRFKQP